MARQLLIFLVVIIVMKAKEINFHLLSSIYSFVQQKKYQSCFDMTNNKHVFLPKRKNNLILN